MTTTTGPGRRCVVCSLEPADRERAELMLVERQSLASIAAQTGASITGLRRHRDRHLIGDVMAAFSAAADSDMTPDAIAYRIKSIADRARDIADSAEDDGRPHVAIAALRMETAALSALYAGGVRDVGKDVDSPELWRLLGENGARAAIRKPEVAEAIIESLTERGEHSIAEAFADLITRMREKALTR